MWQFVTDTKGGLFTYTDSSIFFVQAVVPPHPTHAQAIRTQTSCVSSTL